MCTLGRRQSPGSYTYLHIGALYMYFTANNDAYPYMQFLKLFRNKKVLCFKDYNALSNL